MIPLALWWIRTWEHLIFAYLILYNTLGLVLATVAFFRVRFFLKRLGVQELESLRRSPSTPALTLLVPAYNEQETVVDNVRSLLDLDYPRFEIVIINDGSTDDTMRALRAAFVFRRRDLGHAALLPTARVLTCYEAVPPPGSRASRLLLVEKENGGKADALNAGINAASSDYVCCMDADSVLERDALLQVMQPIIEGQGRVVACGSQVGLANGATIVHGRILQRGLPRRWLALFQVVEYMRSFTTGRAGLDAVDSLLILSGVFAVFRRETLVDVGGFLTKRLTSRIVDEFTGAHDTVGEDMEIIVRLRRYLIEKRLPGRVRFLPYPIAWSQAPERIRDFGKQRDRWYRGLGQVLFFHRKLLFNPAYGHVGLFALPYQLLFEFCGPLIEASAYVFIPVLFWLGLVSTEMLLLFFIVATLYGIFVSVLAVLLAIWTEGGTRDGTKPSCLFDYRRPTSVLRLLAFALLSMFGYRQLQLVYQCRGFWSFVRGNKEWGKFARERFRAA